MGCHCKNANPVPTRFIPVPIPSESNHHAFSTFDVVSRLGTQRTTTTLQLAQVYDVVYITIMRRFIYLLWCPKGRFVYRTREGGGAGGATTAQGGTCV